MYQIEIDCAYCVIACYDPENEDNEPSLQIVQMEGYELYSEGLVFSDVVSRYFEAFYPGGKALTITQDRG